MRTLLIGLVGFLMMCAFVLFSSMPANAEIAQWKIEDAGNGHFYEAISVPLPDGIKWTDAKAAAEKMGGYLATITSAEENTFVYNLIPKNLFFWTQIGAGNFGSWLGGYQDDKSNEPAGNWKWVTVEPWNYTHWSPLEPNNGGGLEDYLGFFHYEPGGTTLHPGDTWNDYLNFPVLENGNPYPMRSFVVEFDSVPEPSTIVLLSVSAVSLLGYVLRRRKQTL
jgi:hypothetical protein